MPSNYNGKISRNTDWGGDASTGFLPVDGASVQGHIKEELAGKIGAVYKPDGINTVYYFSTEEDKQAFIETDDQSYVLYSYELESNYEVLIDRESLVVSHSILKGAKGNTVSFKFKILDNNGISVDPRAKIELSFTGSGVSNRFTNEIPVVAGDWTQYSIIVDDYLRDGSNNVAVKITGESTKATTQFVMTFNIFDLSFNVNFEYNVAKTGFTMSVPYVIECSDPKYLEFFIDGNSVQSSESMVINDVRRDGVATLNISNLSLGQHTLQVRAYVRASDGTLFYTPSYFYTFAKAGDADISFLMRLVNEDGKNLVDVGENLNITLYQFEQIMFDWSIYSYLPKRLVVNFEYDGNIVSRVVVNGNEAISTFNYRPMEDGADKKLKIYALGEEDEKLFEYVIDVDVLETTSGIKETVNGLLLKLQAAGRRNTDADKDVWECVGTDGNTYRAEFSGFTWNSQQGWDEDTESLVISNGAVVNFNIQPMLYNWASQGGTVEMDLETFDIENEDAVICECSNGLNANESFFRVTATKAEFSTQEGSSISTRFKDNERLKIAFIGNPNDAGNTLEDGNLIYIVVNGVLERAALYSSTDRIRSTAFLSIGDPTGQCKVRIRSLRVYNRAITVDEAFNNFVVDSDDVQGIYERNNVIKAGTANEIGFDEVANKLPVMIFTGDMNELVTEGQTSKTTGKWYDFDVEYINRQEPERNFVSFNCKMKLQGTSSLGYPRKNFKLKTKDKNFNQQVYEVSKVELDPNSVVGNIMLRNKETKEPIDFDDFKTNSQLNKNNNVFTFDYEGKALNKGKYRFRKDAHKATKWTLKADFMESSCSHNVGAGRSWNDIFENTELLSNGDASYVDQTYKDSALVSGSSRDYIEYNGINIEGKVTHYKIPYNSQEIKEQKKYVCRTDAQKICKAAGQDDIRTAVDGFPMVCFYRTSHQANDLVFIGQYNFINDKGSYEVFGFEDIEDPDDPEEETMIYDASNVEVFEGLKNTNPISLFKSVDDFYDRTSDGNLFKWQETYESRYPDPEDAESDPILGAALERGVTGLYELSQWLYSTRHEEDTIYGDTLNVDAYFAKRINSYQYGYTSATTASYEYFEGQNLEDNAANRQKKFETEKWEHFDVWKVAGYYVYLMRYGAVDQFVKNTMLFTDGNGKYDPRTDLKYRKWFFINYDNDCLFGLRNNGQLAFHWDLDRKTRDDAADILIDDQVDEQGTNSFAMMGHDSTLWNNLEQDEEFMRMVRDLDYSMSQYKLNYANMVEEFDTKQTERWCERIYNANERYKYIYAAKGIGDMEGTRVNNLWMLQGTRRSHRHWWIANHFNLLDAQWLSGDYKNTYMTILSNSPAGLGIHAIAGMKYYYAWGQDKKIYESNMERREGDAVDFIFSTAQALGDPVKIYSFNKLTEINCSEVAPYAVERSFEFKTSDNLTQNMLKRFIIGNSGVSNNVRIETETWTNMPNLEYLDITNYAGITNVPLSSYRNLHTLKAYGTKLGAFVPAEGSWFERVELPPTISTIEIKDIVFKNNLTADFNYTPNTNLESLLISKSNNGTGDENDGVGISYYNNIVEPWIDSIEASAQWKAYYANKSLTLLNVNWSFKNLDAVRKFKHFREYGEHFEMSGVIDLRGCGNLSMANIDEIKDIFGENCFNQNLSPLYVMTPDSVFIKSDATEMVAKEGETNVFERVIYPDENAILDKLIKIEYYIVTETNRKPADADIEHGERIFYDPIANKNYLVINDLDSVRTGLSLENTRDENGKEIAILSCEERKINSDTTFKVLVYMALTTSAGYDKVSVMDFTVKDPTYATSASISGEKSLYKNKEYTYVLSMATNNNVAPIGAYRVYWTLTGEGLGYVTASQVDTTDDKKFKITMGSSQPSTSEVSSEMTLTARIVNNDYYHTEVSTSFTLLVLNETVVITNVSNPVVMEICYNAGWATKSNAMTKEEAESVTNIGTKFRNKTSQSFAFPEFKYFTGVTSVPVSAFQNSYITEISIPETVTSYGPYCFDGCSRLTGVYVAEDQENGETIYNRTLPNGPDVIPMGMFRNCSSFNQFTLPDSVTNIADFAFGGTAFDEAVLHSAEEGEGRLRLPSYLVGIAGSAFETERWTPTSTTNRLKRLEMPATFIPSDGAYEFLGRNYESFGLEGGHNHERLDIVDDVIFNKDNSVLFRYPPKKEYVEAADTSTASIIRPYAFFAVQNLDYLTLNTYVGNIGEGFCMDSKIKVVDLVAAERVSDIMYDSFKNCADLQHVYFPNAKNIKTIGTGVFYNCPSLEDIVIPDGVIEFKANDLGYTNTFYNCQLLEEIIFPDSVLLLGENTIRNCNGLKKVVLPAYLSYTNTWPEGDYTLRQSEYDGNGELVTLIPNIPYLIITNCPNLESITIPAFTYDKVDVVDGEEEISKMAVNTYKMGSKRWVDRKFRNNSDKEQESTEGFYLVGSESRRSIKEILIADVDNGDNFVSINGALYSSDKAILYRAPWNISHFVLEPETTTIAKRAFSESSIVDAEWGAGLNNVGEGAFAGASNFISSGIVENLVGMGNEAFIGCNFKEVVIGSALTAVSRMGFADMNSMTKITFKGFSGEIMQFAFRNDYMVKTIIVSSDVAPKLGNINQNGIENTGWYSFVGVGSATAGKELLVSVGTSETYLKTPGASATPTTYVVSEETSWRYLVNNLGFQLKEEIPLEGVYELTVFDNNGNPYTGTVYISSTLGGADGPNDTEIFTVEGLYDNEVVSVYSDAAKTNLLGTFRPRITWSEYQIGSPSLGAPKRSAILSASEPKDGETVEVTKEEYDALVSRVNQMVKIIKKLTK